MKLHTIIFILGFVTSPVFADGVGTSSTEQIEAFKSKNQQQLSFKELRECYWHSHHLFNKPADQRNLTSIYLDIQEAKTYMNTKDLVALNDYGFSVDKVKDVTPDTKEDSSVRIFEPHKIAGLQGLVVKEIEDRFKKLFLLTKDFLAKRENPDVLPEATVQGLVESLCACEKIGVGLSQIDRARAALTSDRKHQIKTDNETRLLVKKDLKCEHEKGKIKG